MPLSRTTTAFAAIALLGAALAGSSAAAAEISGADHQQETTQRELAKRKMEWRWLKSYDWSWDGIYKHGSPAVNGEKFKQTVHLNPQYDGLHTADDAFIVGLKRDCTKMRMYLGVGDSSNRAAAMTFSVRDVAARTDLYGPADFAWAEDAKKVTIPLDRALRIRFRVREEVDAWSDSDKFVLGSAQLYCDAE